MKRPATPSSEGEEVPTESSPEEDLPVSNSLLTRITAAPLLRRPLVRLVLVLVPLLVITFVAYWNMRTVHREADAVQESLESTEANVLLASQQLEALFQQMQGVFSSEGELSDADQELLATWLRYDETFLLQNEENPAARYECALAHRRYGQGMMIKGELDKAVAHFRQAIALFQVLGEEMPGSGSRAVELADTNVRLGWALRKSHQYEDADLAYRNAAALLTDEQLVADVQRDPHVSFDPLLMDVYIQDNLAEWALEQGNRDEAVSHLAQVADVLRQLVIDFPDHAGYRANLAAAESRLNAARQPPAGS